MGDFLPDRTVGYSMGAVEPLSGLFFSGAGLVDGVVILGLEFAGKTPEKHRKSVNIQEN